MESVFLVLLLLLGVIGGNVLAKHVPKIPQPFFLIGFGLLFSVIPLYQGFQLNPAVFTFAIIAPLMYHEAENVSRYWVGRGMVNILSLAVVLVVLTVLLVGTGLHAALPVIPLSLAFALCAIVTPTDAAAVSAITPSSEDYRIPQIILENESLFNDASGIVAFDLALAAYVSGEFSVGHALIDFGREFLGGLLLGAILGLMIAQVRQWLIRWGDDSPIVLVTLELVTPFMLYYLADAGGFSGILAVVAAGLVQSVEQDQLRLRSSHMQLVRTNVWGMIDEILSGLVFVLLGISLPRVIQGVWHTQQFPWWQLVVAGVGIYGLKLALRLVWTRYFVWMHKTSPHRWLDSWLMALSGANGTITLALAFSLPLTIEGQPFALRGTLIFLAAVVILLSLLMPTLVLPLILKAGPTSNQELKKWSNHIRITAIRELEHQQAEHSSETQIVVDALRQQFQQREVPHRHQQRALFKRADQVESRLVTTWLEQQKITPAEAADYRHFLSYSRFTVDQRWWKNLILRIYFSLHMGRMDRDIQTAQDTFMTSPLVMEQIYWQRQFEQKGFDIRPLETAGYRAALASLKACRQSTNRTANDVVQRYYHERHRQINLPEPDSDVVYELFLNAFHAEYELVQAAFTQRELTSELAQKLQAQIIADQASYIQNRTMFLM
ncbi:cation:proton antiporter [Levilactobacillus spicheri]|uniref:Sodium, potassium, lithium and rubidium/H(+) antiporter n=1 Tax=Levilactobacillus spicheri TaxID=216463 RepID=A0A0F3RRI1_9LACO|nr:sodium:proton antiporter [Levilactobacillus spicheri]KJW12601.1 sodium, potassium, lithium and rubidium/H(+) antiporter [Levilactobacillus spicheri]